MSEHSIGNTSKNSIASSIYENYSDTITSKVLNLDTSVYSIGIDSLSELGS